MRSGHRSDPPKGNSDEFKKSWIESSWHRFRPDVFSATDAFGNESRHRDWRTPIATLAERVGVFDLGRPESLDVETFRRKQ